MLTFRQVPVKAGRAAAVTFLLAGCGFLNPATMVAPVVMTVSSDAFGQGVLPHSFTCYAPHPVSPPVTWSGAPAGTAEYALVMDDSSAPITPFIYWLVFGIQPGTTDIQQGSLPRGAREAPNSTGTTGYDPPCPHGSPHKYRFTVYALNRQLSLPANVTVEQAWQAIAAATIGRGRAEAEVIP